MLKSEWLSELQKYETNDILVKSSKFYSLATTLIKMNCISGSNWDKNLGHPRIKRLTYRQCEVSSGLKIKQRLHGTSHCSCLEHCFLFILFSCGPQEWTCEMGSNWENLMLLWPKMWTSHTHSMIHTFSLCFRVWTPVGDQQWRSVWLWVPRGTDIPGTLWGMPRGINRSMVG